MTGRDPAAGAPATWREAHERVARELDVVMFTVLRFTDGGATMERVYSSHPDAYPVGGTKDVATQVSSEWTAVARDAGRPMLMATPADIRRVFGDAATILGLGIGALVNVPIVDRGRVVGSVSVSGPAGAYDEADVMRAVALLAGTETIIDGGTDTAGTDS